MPSIFLYYEYDDVYCYYWRSEKGYYYRQHETDRKPKRISQEEYILAYESYYNL
jgi:hypothetical protein